MRSSLISILLLIHFINQAQNLILNEVCAINDQLILDAKRESSDWIELKNISSNDINLSEYSVFNTQSKEAPWTLPEIKIEPDSLYFLFASKSAGILNDTAHTNFSLERYNDTIWLAHNNIVVDSLYWVEFQKDISIGRTIDNETVNYFMKPTLGKPNSSTGYLGICSDPKISINSQFFTDSLKLSVMAKYPIHYTTNLYSPSTSSNSYSEPILFDNSATFAFQCIKPEYIPSNIIYRTYIKGESTNLPTAFFHTNPDNLFSESYGLFMIGNNADTDYPYYGANYWSDESFPAAIDLLSADNKIQFSGSVGFKMHGGTSARNKAQKPIRLIWNERYGNSKLKAKIFATKDVDKFKRLVLRNSGGDFNNTHFRDGILHQIMLKDKLDIELSGYTPINTFINGKPWGIYNIREKVGKHYLESNFNHHRDSVDIIEESYSIVQGDTLQHYNLFQFAVNNDLSEESNFNHIDSFIDLHNLTDYFCAEIILANADWPYNNLKIWKPRNKGKWRYILYDLDASLAKFSWVGSDYNMWERFRIPGFQSDAHVNVFLELLKNQSFRKYFINRYADLANTTFSEKRYLIEQKKTVDLLSTTMTNHFKVWGSNQGNWEMHIAKTAPWVKERETFHRNHLQEELNTGNQYNLELNIYPENSGSIKLNTLSLSSFPWDGVYFNKNAIDIKAFAKAGFEFKYWRIHNTDSIYYSDSLQIDFNIGAQVTAYFEASTGFKNQLEVSPSPLQNGNLLSLKYHQPSTDQPQIKLFDTKGKIVYSEQFRESKMGYKTETIQIPLLSQGAYFIQIEGKKFKFTTKLSIH